jgi:glucosamine 6-phosphate synthetase-like amidotransferase/phosphosugar isomerase protein
MTQAQANSGRHDFGRARSQWRRAPSIFRALDWVCMSACTAYYTGLVAKYWFQRLARLPVEIDVASEFRYRESPLKEGGLALFVFAVGRNRGYPWDAASNLRSSSRSPSAKFGFMTRDLQRAASA